MPTLRATINELASTFAQEVLAALRSASLKDLLAETPTSHVVRRGPGRPRKTHAAPADKRSSKRIRRSPADIAKTVDQIVAVVKTHKKGINAEDIRHALKVARKELPKPIAMALASKRIHKRGKKRSTIYFAG